MLDPMITGIIAIGFGLLFITAALHKFGSISQFQAILQAYQVLPTGLVRPVAVLLPLLELGLGLAWLLSAILSVQFLVVPLASALLLGCYGFAICLNLLRGRDYIDCGCGFSTSIGSQQNTSQNQQLSAGLLLRNILLIAIALLAISRSNERLLGILDYVNLAFATIAIILIYGAFNQLLVNKNAMGAWSRRRG